MNLVVLVFLVNLIIFIAYLLFVKRLSYAVRISGRLLNIILFSSRTNQLSAEFKKLYLGLLYNIVLLILAIGAAFGSYYLITLTFPVGKSMYIFLIATIPSVLAIFAFLKSHDVNGYSINSRALHEFFLDNSEIGKYLLGKYVSGNPQKEFKSSGVIIVTGLARSGTTALTKAIFEHDNEKITSLTYRQMPLLAYPIKFKRSSFKTATKERSHNDGIKIGLDSIEAFDEHIFKLLTDSKYVGSRTLNVHELDPIAWRDYFAFINRYSHGRTYITKNNNFILRLKSYLELKNESSKVVVIVRRPEEVALSLLRQHLKQSDHQREDPFVKNYMGWLGHFEFGLDHKPFNFVKEIGMQEYPKEDVNYWLGRWIDYHSFLLENIDVTKLHLVTYDDFCIKPDLVVSKILAYSNIDSELQRSLFQKTSYPFDKGFDLNLVQIATELYTELETFSILRKK